MAGAALGAALPAVYAAAVRAGLRHNLRALQAGDPGPLVRAYAPDAELRFPGEHSWGRTYRGRQEIEGFLRRFLAAGLRGEIVDVLVAGPPWRTRIAVRFDDEAVTPEGERLYENRAVLYARLAWGRIVDEEVFEDTQKVAAFDARLAERGLAPAAA